MHFFDIYYRNVKEMLHFWGKKYYTQYIAFIISSLLSDLIINTVIPNLLDNLDETKDLYTRHGSLVAVGGSIIGLADSIKKEGKSLQQCFGKKVKILAISLLCKRN